MEKRLIVFILLQFLFAPAFAQDNDARYPDSIFSTYYHQRNSLFKATPAPKGNIVFLGNSITDGGEWSELFNDTKLVNRGISGDNVMGVKNRVLSIAKTKPEKVFLMIGVNDLARGTHPDTVYQGIIDIVGMIASGSPTTKIYVQSILPVNPSFPKFNGHTSKSGAINIINTKLKEAQQNAGFRYIDLHAHFIDKDGFLDKRFTNDGLHLTGGAYFLWKHLVFAEVYDLGPKPALIPIPVSVRWEKGFFDLYACKTIFLQDTLFATEANHLKEQLQKKGLTVAVQNASSYLASASSHTPAIILKKSNPVSGVSKEAYQLSVQHDRVEITAATAHGVFNAIQTFLQLARDGLVIDACSISDDAAFSIRGYMFDVGRNYQSISLIKQQIDVMAAFKLNVFHMHLTEDIAWRIESKKFPQLVAASNMQRNPGEYYTYDELRELIAYCKVRHISFVPEIDMPGHSAAFKRAAGFDMQQPEGKALLKEVLLEFLDEIDVPYLHVGGDEVTYTDKSFLKDMIGLIRSRGKKVIAWDPGGDVPFGTIHQLWNGNKKPWAKEPSIDSRHLYLNHFDPLEGVSATFNHAILDAEKGDSLRLGAILCNWPDRRLAKEEDALRMSPVYPVMLAFAERSWKGGGYSGYSSAIGNPGDDKYEAFFAFEKRLLDVSKIPFSSIYFPYRAQSTSEWTLIGPYANKGDLGLSFAPDNKSFWDTVKLASYPKVYGGTIWLRHFWHPMIGSHVEDPKENTTWYAYQKVYSEKEGFRDCWIGFTNLSRSTASATPPKGQWDNRNSKLWVNGKTVDPPVWKYPGRKPSSLEDPLVDEGYEYRAPTKVYFKKGWNEVLIKAPVGSFKGHWSDPVKWMFSFVLAD